MKSTFECVKVSAKYDSILRYRNKKNDGVEKGEGGECENMFIFDHKVLPFIFWWNEKHFKISAYELYFFNS